MIVKLLVEGGNMKPGPAIAQKLGPLGINMGQVIQKVNQATESFKGLKVPVELNVDTKTKEIEVKVSSPPASELIKNNTNSCESMKVNPKYLSWFQKQLRPSKWERFKGWLLQLFRLNQET